MNNSEKCIIIINICVSCEYFSKKKTNMTKLKRNNDDQFSLPVVKVKR